MVVDTSAVIAVLLDELESQAFSDAMEADGEVLLSTATAVELLIVATGKAMTFSGMPSSFLTDRSFTWSAGWDADGRRL